MNSYRQFAVAVVSQLSVLHCCRGPSASCHYRLYLAAVCQQLAQHLQSAKVLAMGPLPNLHGKKWGYGYYRFIHVMAAVSIIKGEVVCS